MGDVERRREKGGRESEQCLRGTHVRPTRTRRTSGGFRNPHDSFSLLESPASLLDSLSWASDLEGRMDSMAAAGDGDRDSSEAAEEVEPLGEPSTWSKSRPTQRDARELRDDARDSMSPAAPSPQPATGPISAPSAARGKPRHTQ
jgi:hypothetical protein